ncbi:helix-turn-helix domain-containing protein [Leuconostoc suionicum]|nr:helix-turn-helix domain-containing protein [Leuconostoc suionicum]
MKVVHFFSIRAKLYGPNAKNPQRRAVYRNIVDELEKETAISKIAKEYEVTRQTVYRIKN